MKSQKKPEVRQERNFGCVDPDIHRDKLRPREELERWRIEDNITYSIFVRRRGL